MTGGQMAPTSLLGQDDYFALRTQERDSRQSDPRLRTYGDA